ncbi:MAG: hypothetical protein JWM16_929 [Verrucomicrobiales bacterium]|nr:hypothetical protein [Verrucomicrobiales bacterium]
MFHPVDTQVPGEVEAQVQSLYLKLFPNAERAFVPRSFEWFMQCFAGHFDEYQAVDALYHDIEHTLQGTLCLTRLLYNRHQAKVAPMLTERMFQLAILAILFHDTGYLKKRNDTEGTGAKYTPVHVGRSAAFAREFLLKKGFPDHEIQFIQNMISCTGVNADLQTIPFGGELERILGFALTTADLLGQMAASDYVEKLPVLYQEFAEAARYSGQAKATRYAFKSPEELMRNTPDFWEHYVLPKINNDFQQLYRFLSDPYPDGPNIYLEKIEANIRRLRQLAPAAKQG